jgi:hypothetical protein
MSMPDGRIEIFLDGGNNPYNISWFNVDSDESIGSGSVISNLDQGLYFAMIEDLTGCSIFSDTITILLNTSVGEMLLNSTTIYPNPASDFIIIEDDYLIEQVSIYDRSGKMVFSEKPNDYNTRINLNLKDGIYFISIITRSPRKKRASYPIIIVH